MLSIHFDDALTFATRLHAGQSRTGTGVPSIAHPLVVADNALDDGGTEADAIAEMLLSAHRRQRPATDAWGDPLAHIHGATVIVPLAVRVPTDTGAAAVRHQDVRQDREVLTLPIVRSTRMAALRHHRVKQPLPHAASRQGRD